MLQLLVNDSDLDCVNTVGDAVCDGTHSTIAKRGFQTARMATGELEQRVSLETHT